MDVLNIVRTTRMMRMWMQIMLNPRQRILLHYQRSLVVDSSESDFDGSDENEIKKEVSSTNKVMGVVSLGRKV